LIGLCGQGQRADASDGHQLAEIGDLLGSGHIRPVIDRVFPFDQGKQALACLETGRAKGKVVVRMSDATPTLDGRAARQPSTRGG